MDETNPPLLPEMTQVWQHLNWQPNTEQQFLFQRLYESILEGNRQLNLTRITEPLEFWEKHLWDSLRPIMPLLGTSSAGILPAERKEREFKVIDIGTGAGFPGLPVAIALPDAQVTLLDSTRKKVTFLDTLLAQLSIQNANTLLGRAEVVGQLQHRQAYDLALIRAVGSASVCAEYALPFLKLGGLAVLYRGNWTKEESESLESTVKKLGGAVETVEEFVTPLSNSIRHCVYLRLTAIPLKFGKPVKQSQ